MYSWLDLLNFCKYFKVRHHFYALIISTIPLLCRMVHRFHENNPIGKEAIYGVQIRNIAFNAKAMYKGPEKAS
jgi:hypothetical protein